MLSARLHQMPDCHKIKLRAIGYRSVYQVDDTAVTVPVFAVGKREKIEAYRAVGEPEREWLADGKDEAAAGRCIETAVLFEWGMNLTLFSLYPTKLACSARKPCFVRNFAELRSKSLFMPAREAIF